MILAPKNINELFVIRVGGETYAILKTAISLTSDLVSKESLAKIYLNKLISMSNFNIEFHIYRPEEIKHPNQIWCVWIGPKSITPPDNWWIPARIP